VAGVVAAILLVAGLASFLAMVRVSWMPVWTEQAEARHSDDLRLAFQGWADTAEDFIARSLTGRSFTRTLPVGAQGMSIPLLGGGGPTSGTLEVRSGPSLTVSLAGSVKATALGELLVKTSPTRFAPQEFRFVLGAFEVNQTSSSWVDLRSLLTVSRTTNNKLDVTVQAVNLTGFNQSLATGGLASAVGTLNSTSSDTPGAGTVRVLADGISGFAWRAGANRTLSAAGLTGSSASDCTIATSNFCFDTDTSDADTMDLYLLNVKASWRATSGLFNVEVRS
jgi:hypothetical protein